MPFDIGESINYFSERFTKFPIVNTIIRNPIYTALMIAFVIVLMTLFVFRNIDFSDEDSGIVTLSLRLGTYLFIIVSGILFLHNQCMINENRSKLGSSQLDSMFNNTVRGGVHVGGKHVVSADSSLQPGLTESLVPVRMENFPDDISSPDFTS